MRGRLALAAILCLFSTLPTVSFAQTGVGVGVGVGTGISRSTSAAGAVAIGGGNAQSRSQAAGGAGSASATANGSNGNSSSALTVNSQAAPAATSVNTTGMQTLKTVPNAYSPGLSAAGLETCLGSISGGGSAVGWGASFGTTIPDPGCNARLDARTLWSIGLKAAAIARLCQSVDIYNSMPDICNRYRPGQPAAYNSYAALTPVGQIELIEGKTGQTRMCDNYDASRARCLAWTGAAKPYHKRTAKSVVASAKSTATAVEPVPVQPTVTDPPLPQ